MQFSGLASPDGMSLAQVIGGSENDLRTFIATFFGRTFGISSNDETVITIRQLPEEGILSELTLPDNLTVVGTVFRSAHNSHELLFTTQTPDDTFKATFIENLKSDGWQDLPQSANYHRGGFTAHASFTVMLCHPQKQMRLNLSIDNNGLSNLTIHPQRNPCQDPHQGHMTMMAQLPALTLPSNLVSTYQQGSGGGSNDHVHSSATIITDASLSDLFAHYQTQLQDAGWTLSKHHALDDLSMSYWDVAIDGETWRGKLMLAEIPNSNHVELWLEMRAPLM